MLATIAGPCMIVAPTGTTNSPSVTMTTTRKPVTSGSSRGVSGARWLAGPERNAWLGAPAEDMARDPTVTSDLSEYLALNEDTSRCDNWNTLATSRESQRLPRGPKATATDCVNECVRRYDNVNHTLTLAVDAPRIETTSAPHWNEGGK
jgi:hypothetical protein